MAAPHATGADALGTRTRENASDSSSAGDSVICGLLGHSLDLKLDGRTAHFALPQGGAFRKHALIGERRNVIRAEAGQDANGAGFAKDVLSPVFLLIVVQGKGVEPLPVFVGDGLPGGNLQKIFWAWRAAHA